MHPNDRKSGLFNAGSMVVALLLMAGFSFSSAFAQPQGDLFDPAYHHLGASEQKSWAGTDAKPEGTSLRREFQVAAPVEGTLKIKQRDVNGVWRLKLNGAEIAQLDRVTEERISHYRVPAGNLRTGVNVLEVIPDNKKDDIAIGQMEWIPTSIRNLLQLRAVMITVSQSGSKLPVPARISIIDDQGKPADIHLAEAEDRAVRPGIVYTRGSVIKIELASGRYHIAATRGMEWSRDERVLDLSGPQAGPEILALKLRREVDTRGFVATDTHIHTYTHSGHGNATIEERMISLAGEGVELAIATDHNHSVDYRPVQSRLSLNAYFTPVVGNEVTTVNGHFNAFPMDPNGSLPDHKETEWTTLVQDIRSKGAKVVVLNHPRWPDASRNPFTKAGMNRASGDRARGEGFTFDAMELVNSTALQDDPLYLFTDWFSLMNRGEWIKAVGSSDTHSVDDPVGQGRTYIPSSTDNASQVKVDEACSNLLAGRASVSLGMFADVRVEGRYGMGDKVPSRGGPISARLRVAAPSWITPEKAMVFLNGIKIAEQPVPHKVGTATDVKLVFQLATRNYDSHLVFVVLGQGIKAHGWTTYKNYTLAATNPVFLDADGDGVIRSVRDEATKRLGARSGDLTHVLGQMAQADAALGVQLASVASSHLDATSLVRLRENLTRLASSDALYALYVKHLPAPAK